MGKTLLPTNSSIEVTSVSLLGKLVLIYSTVMLQESKFSFQNSCKETYELTSKDLQGHWTYKNLTSQLVCPHTQESPIHMAEDGDGQELR